MMLHDEVILEQNNIKRELEIRITILLVGRIFDYLQIMDSKS